MFLKTENKTDAFDPTALSLSLSADKKSLTVPYLGGAIGQHVVVYAFKKDNLTSGTTSYAATAELKSVGTDSGATTTIDVSNWDIDSLDDYTIKVWMEDASDGSSLAAATAPVTFVGSEGSITKTETGAVTNQRVFAMKNDLQTSWGTLANKTDLVGADPTNQKIYFGTYVDTKDSNKVKPLEFWIAGRETYAGDPTVLDGDGTIDSNGEIMTLYQAKSVQPTKKFNASTSSYAGNGKTVTLQLADEQTAVYTGSAVAYPEKKITATVTGDTIDKSKLVWQHRANEATAWMEGMPTAVGTYQLRCYALGEPESYERTYSSIVDFKVMGTPQVSDFSFTKPTNLTYDGNQKTAAVITEQSGMGDITVKYYKEDGTTPAVGSDATTAPTNVGPYTVKIDVKEGTLYSAASDLTDETWTFTISPAKPTYSAPSLTPQKIVYGSKLNQVDLSAYNLGSPTFGGKTISGTWSWVDAPITYVGPVTQPDSPTTFKAKFTPTVPLDTQNFDCSSVVVSVPINVQPLPVGVRSITLSDTEFTYNGAEQTPTITITANNTQLNAGSDYTVAYSGDKKSAGAQPITIKFQGNYASDADNDDAADNPDQGVKTSYTIKPATLTVDSITVASKTYDGTADATAAVTLRGAQNGETLSQGTDFEVDAQFVDGDGNSDANVGKNKKVSATTSLNTTDTAKNYTFADDGSVQNEISVTKGTTAEITPATLTVESITAENKTYDGTADATVTDVQFDGLVTPPGDTQETLELGTDFTVSNAKFADANVGTAKQVTATITLNNTATAKNYTFADNGSVKNEITVIKDTTAGITAFDISSAVVELEYDSKDYTGTALTPDVTSVTVKLKQGDDTQTTLEEGKDYTVEYSDNTDAGKATVTITGTGNFEGEKSANFTISQKSLTGAEITIDPSSMVYTGKQLKPKITSVIVDGITVPSAAYAMTVSDATTAGQEVTVTLAAKSDSNFTGSASTTFTITKAAPGTSGLKPTPSLTATYGQTLGDITAGLASAIGSFLDVDGDALEGEWLWSDDATTKVGNVGENKFTAIFTPTDDNYAKTTIDVTVKVSVDTSKWGEAQKRDADGKTQYVDSAGKTSVEIARENLDKNGILWLREESGGTSAWYGIDLSTGAFDLDKGLRFYVQWLSPDDAEYAEIYAQLDEDQKARVEDDNGWIFLIGVEDPDGNKVQPAHPAKVYVQLGDPNEGADWDLEHLKAYYITSGGDENVPVEDVTNFAYPGGTDEFGMMTLSHFSPYFIFDELTDEEKAALELKPEDGNNHPTDKPDSSGTDLPGTGDISTTLFFAGLAIVLVSSLGVMLRLITSKKKFEK